MLVEIRQALIITRREVRDQLRDWRIVVPIILLTLFFPFLANFTTGQILGFVGKYGANLIADRFIPFLLMIVGFFPISISLVIALESFAGETERKSIEPLLSSPLSDGQLYLGKLSASLIIPLIASYLGMAVYLVAIYRTSEWRPDLMFLLLVGVLTTVQAVVMVSGAVVISTQTTSVRAANLLASFIIIPVSLMIQAESVMMLWTNYQVLWWAVAGLIVLAGLLVRMGIAHMNREELLGRELDTLNLSWMWKVFRQQFSGGAHSLWEWYGQEIPRTLQRMLIPIGWMVALLAGATALGVMQVKNLGISPNVLGLDRLKLINTQLLNQFRQYGFFNTSNALSIWWHNLRATAIAAILGVFTLGVAGTLVLMLPMVIIGFVSGATSLTGFSLPVVVAAFTLPHGLLEIPALVLSGAAILQVGASLVTPNHKQSISEALMSSMADWAKITLALVIPLFLGAAFLEVFVSPQLMVKLLGGG
jgi:uncharacterized membrane protein SpoIIM required for sporulation/ABC-type transport system involved in multi-copper enzyme maturation permease subunit